MVLYCIAFFPHMVSNDFANPSCLQTCNRNSSNIKFDLGRPFRAMLYNGSEKHKCSSENNNLPRARSDGSCDFNCHKLFQWTPVTGKGGRTSNVAWAGQVFTNWHSLHQIWSNDLVIVWVKMKTERHVAVVNCGRLSMFCKWPHAGSSSHNIQHRHRVTVKCGSGEWTMWQINNNISFCLWIDQDNSKWMSSWLIYTVKSCRWWWIDEVLLKPHKDSVTFSYNSSGL